MAKGSKEAGCQPFCSPMNHRSPACCKLSPGWATRWLTRPLSKPASPTDCGLEHGPIFFYQHRSVKFAWKFTENTSHAKAGPTLHNTYSLRPRVTCTHTLIMHPWLTISHSSLACAFPWWCIHTVKNASCSDHKLQCAEVARVYFRDLPAHFGYLNFIAVQLSGTRLNINEGASWLGRPMVDNT